MTSPFKRRLAHWAAAAVLSAGAFRLGAAADDVEVVFRATCGDLTGHRVDMDPTDPSEQEQWRTEVYRASPPPEGHGTLELLSDEAHTDSIRVAWGSGGGRFLPIAYKSKGQISIADVDPYGVWIITLFFQAEKVVISRQTIGPYAGAVGAIVQGSCELQAG